MHLTTGETPIWLATSSVDFRKSIDGLCAVVSEELGCLPRDGIFIFYNSARNRVKILLWHHNGFVVIYKRFEQGRLFVKHLADEGKMLLDSQQLNWLMMGVDWQILSHKNTCYFENHA